MKSKTLIISLLLLVFALPIYATNGEEPELKIFNDEEGQWFGVRREVFTEFVFLLEAYPLLEQDKEELDQAYNYLEQNLKDANDEIEKGNKQLKALKIWRIAGPIGAFVLGATLGILAAR